MHPQLILRQTARPAKSPASSLASAATLHPPPDLSGFSQPSTTRRGEPGVCLVRAWPASENLNSCRHQHLRHRPDMPRTNTAEKILPNFHSRSVKFCTLGPVLVLVTLRFHRPL